MNIEDYIELLANFNEQFSFSIDVRDKKLISSLGTQVSKNIGLTDRQYELAKQKIIEYKQQFVDKNFNNLDIDLQNLRIPIRSIDRSKTVKIIERTSIDLFGYHTEIMLAIRFPYNKKMIKYINLINSLRVRKEYDKTTKTHFLPFNENNVLKIVETLKNANFNIDDFLLDWFNSIKKIEQHPEEHLPGIYNYKLKHLHPNAIKYIISELGNPSLDNLALYYDRKNQIGLGYFDKLELQKSLNKFSPLTKNIAESDNKKIFLSSQKYNLENICDSLIELKRLPLLVILKKGYEDYGLTTIYNTLSKSVNDKDISVLFRLDNSVEESISFNNTVKKLKLNNPVTDKTKVVFVSHEKIPKPLLRSNWNSSTTLLLESFRHTKTFTTFINASELTIHYDTIASTWFSETLTHL